jgi:hypothetical protein
MTYRLVYAASNFKTKINCKNEFVGEGRSRQEDAETSCRPGWAQPKQTPSPSDNQPRAQVLPQVRNYSEWGFIGLKGVEQVEMEG